MQRHSVNRGVPVGRIATQTRHSRSDTSSVLSPSVCARVRTKSLRSSSRVVTPVCGEGKRPGSTHKGLRVGSDGACDGSPRDGHGVELHSRPRSVSPKQKETSTQVSTRTCLTHNTARRAPLSHSHSLSLSHSLTLSLSHSLTLSLSHSLTLSLSHSFNLHSFSRNTRTQTMHVEEVESLCGGGPCHVPLRR